MRSTISQKKFSRLASVAINNKKIRPKVFEEVLDKFPKTKKASAWVNLRFPVPIQLDFSFPYEEFLVLKFVI